MHKPAGVVVAALIAMGLTACSSSTPPGTVTVHDTVTRTAAVTRSETMTQAATTTELKTVTTSARPEASSPIPPSPTVAEPPAVPSSSGEPGPSGGGGPVDTSFAMPDEVGKGLQQAQDDIQVASGNPLFFTRSKDATGNGRHQVLDRDWKVCSQVPAAGTRVDASSDITFSVVKLSETCP